MISCLSKLVKNIRDEKSIITILSHIQNYNGIDWKEYLIYNQYNSYAKFTLYKNSNFQLKLIGLDSRYYYQSDKNNWIKVLENDIRICNLSNENNKNLLNNKDLIYNSNTSKIITSFNDIYNLKTNEIILPKSEPTGTLHLLIL